MKMRRRISGLFALIALVFSFAGTARGSTCEMPAHHGMPGHAPAQHHESMPNCPLAAGQIGCSATASLPGTRSVLAAPAQHTMAFFSNDVVLPHSRRTTVIFHPPRF